MRRISLLLAVLVLAAGIAMAPRHLASRVATGEELGADFGLAFARGESLQRGGAARGGFALIAGAADDPAADVGVGVFEEVLGEGVIESHEPERAGGARRSRRRSV